MRGSPLGDYCKGPGRSGKKIDGEERDSGGPQLEKRYDRATLSCEAHDDGESSRVELIRSDQPLSGDAKPNSVCSDRPHHKGFFSSKIFLLPFHTLPSSSHPPSTPTSFTMADEVCHPHPWIPSHHAPSRSPSPSGPTPAPHLASPLFSTTPS